ncbi:Diaminohydroxyphosphoribosylaminopyrimidine deaminase / 5-amino-6-(5-phosphoribosylamino)uracil reductase [uncultured Gammaproteobacteria bacterium]
MSVTANQVGPGQRPGQGFGGEAPDLVFPDLVFMAAALALARRGLGMVWPNPAVGCVLVRDRVVVGRGWTQPGGRPHAETEALKRAGTAARGATAYVTLEPCSHHGKTAPCAEALIAAGVARVVAACLDPDPRVCGAGIARLRAAGLAVTTGVREAEACELNQGFFLRVLERRVLVTLKLATSLDGRTATATGASQWITGPEARARGQALRAEHDAILVGIGTALADDPELTCRLPGLEPRSPLRLVLDSHARLPLTSRLVQTARQTPVWLLTGNDADPERCSALAETGVEIVSVPAAIGGGLDLGAVLTVLADRGLTRVLVEGGSRVATALLRARKVDRLEWFRSPMVIGGDGLPAVAGLEVAALSQACVVCDGVQVAVGRDWWESYRLN